MTDGATTATQTAVCEAILLTADMGYTTIRSLTGVAESLEAEDVEAVELTPGLLMWRDIRAAMDSTPMLNFAAMHLQLRLLGPIAVCPIYGRVLLTGCTTQKSPRPLSVSEIRDIRFALRD